jgi:hypothetical protein
MNRATATLCGVATDMGSGKAKIFADILHEQCAILDVSLDGLSINRE